MRRCRNIGGKAPRYKVLVYLPSCQPKSELKTQPGWAWLGRRQLQAVKRSSGVKGGCCPIGKGIEGQGRVTKDAQGFGCLLCHPPWPYC